MPSGSVPLHALGRYGPKVPALGFGLMGMSHSYGAPPTDEERFIVLDRALELGATFWDSSDLYGDNEELLGKWFERTGKRHQIFLATKFGFVKGSKAYATDSSSEYCKKACDASLSRLGIDQIDLYYVHSVNPETPIEETMRALLELQKEGKIKYIGLSSVSSATLRRACKIGTVDAVQTEYSVFTHDIEGPAGTGLLATCRELGVGIVIATPLGRGLFTTTFSDGETPKDPTDARTRVLPRFQEGNVEKNVEIVKKLRVLAEKKGCTVAQLSLAWLLKQGSDIFPIPGTKRVKYLEENWGALDVQLSEEDEAEIRTFGQANALAGETVRPEFKSYLYRDTIEESA